MKKTLIALSMIFMVACGNRTNKQGSDEEVNFSWDFSQPKNIIYSYTQEVEADFKMDKEGASDKTTMWGDGQLKVQVKDSKLADLSISDFEIKMVSFGKDDTPGDTTTQTSGISVVQDMNADGSFAAHSDVIFNMLFPLPKKNIGLNDTDEIPLQMPFNVSGSRLVSKGQITLSFLKYGELDGRSCAIFKGEIDISKLDIPEELNGEYKSSTTGTGTYYFDVDNGYYLGSDVEMIMYNLIDTGSEDEYDFGFGETSSKNIFKIRFQEVEE